MLNSQQSNLRFTVGEGLNGVHMIASTLGEPARPLLTGRRRRSGAQFHYLATKWHF